MWTIIQYDTDYLGGLRSDLLWHRYALHAHIFGLDRAILSASAAMTEPSLELTLKMNAWNRRDLFSHLHACDSTRNIVHLAQELADVVVLSCQQCPCFTGL